MPKTNPEELNVLGEDLRWVLKKNHDVLQHNPDFAAVIVKLRDKAFALYDQGTEVPLQQKWTMAVKE